jgi:D-amino-acid oxidase
MNRRVLVLGAGVSGLTTARCLIDSKFDVTVLAEKSAEFTPSVVAGALWEWPPAVCGYHKNPDSLRKSKLWSATSYQRFSQLATQPKTGVRMMPAVFYFRQRVEEHPAERQKMEETKLHVKDFKHTPDLIEQHGVNRGLGLCDAYSYLSPLIETNLYMEWLRNELVMLGCRFEQRELLQPLADLEKSLCDEYKAGAIVNCSGLGSIKLAGDHSMQPLRGALIRVLNDGSSMPQITAAHCVAHDDKVAHQQMIYIVPRGPDYLLLGGIAELGEWDTNINFGNYAPIRDILHRCQEFMPILKSAVIDEHDSVKVGLRPYREKNVRLERQAPYRLFHNYGHGGSGFTFSWGCAEETVSLIKAMLEAESAPCLA